MQKLMKRQQKELTRKGYSCKIVWVDMTSLPALNVGAGIFAQNTQPRACVQTSQLILSLKNAPWFQPFTKLCSRYRYAKTLTPSK